MLSSNTPSGSADAVYVEDVFSAYTYTGNASTQTINNGIDLAGKGGMIWFKNRTIARPHGVFDTARGFSDFLQTNGTNAQISSASFLSSVNTNGFSMLSDSFYGLMNGDSGAKYVSWTFRKQPKFFDVVTYTGNGVAGRTIAHNLGSVPGCMIIKQTDASREWVVYHRSLGNTQGIILNSTAAAFNAVVYNQWNSTTPTSTEFTVGSDSDVNTNGGTYVAYLFAHDAGGFGLTGTDNVISCGSYTEPASGADQEMDIGFEAQFVLLKKVDGVGNWELHDTMRGLSYISGGKLYPNVSDAEVAQSGYIMSSPRGFIKPDGYYGAGSNIIYIAIRRGPMKVPTDGTAVYKSVLRSGTGATPWKASGAGFPPDMTIMSARAGSAVVSTGYQNSVIDRLRRAKEHIQTINSEGEGGGWGDGHIHNMDGYDGLYSGDSGYYNNASTTFVDHHFRRFRSFFDIVFGKGTSSAEQARSHNLGVVPELIFAKDTLGAPNWTAYSSALGQSKYLNPNNVNAATSSSNVWGATAHTATTFYAKDTANWCASVGNTGVFYLFATCPGISKVGSYIGTGTTQNIDCGFLTGARFVLIKRTDTTGDWALWDSARGIVESTEPFSRLQNFGAEVTGTDYIDPYSAGFQISSTAGGDINASGGAYIFLAIA